MIVSVDFDDCLRYGGELNQAIAALVYEYFERGDEVHIVTARSYRHENQEYCNKYYHETHRVLVKDFVEQHNLPINKIWYTNHELKGPTLQNAGASIHYDDNHEHLHSAHDYGIEAYTVQGSLILPYNPNDVYAFCYDTNCIVCSGDYR